MLPHTSAMSAAFLSKDEPNNSTAEKLKVEGRQKKMEQTNESVTTTTTMMMMMK
jgi:hypothetical protein